jgi:hypothetical protein
VGEQHFVFSPTERRRLDEAIIADRNERIMNAAELVCQIRDAASASAYIKGLAEEILLALAGGDSWDG